MAGIASGLGALKNVTGTIHQAANPSMIRREKYSLAEINCDKPHPAKFSGRSLELELDGPFDSAVFELRTK